MYHLTQMIGLKVCLSLFNHDSEVKVEENEKPFHYPACVTRFTHQVRKCLMMCEEHNSK